jgi:hypothetical protein
VFGGMWRRPGPSLRGNFGCEGRDAGSRISPGSTNVSVAIVLSLGLGFLDPVCFA